MSIYRRPGWVYGHNLPSPAQGDADAPITSSAKGSSAESQDWSKWRKAQPAEHLLRVSETWLDHLPREVYPAALATQYPRIVNLIAMQWNDLHRCQHYFDELLVDRRGGRQGFPVAVMRDLLTLHEHWYGLKPSL